MEKHKVYENQSWVDLSIQLFGNPDFAFDLAFLNQRELTNSPRAGEEVMYPPLPVNKLVVMSMNTNSSIPATTFDLNAPGVVEDFGIGEMAIASTFIIR